MQIDTSAGRTGHRVVAVLGPTNTGKTHLAMERMLGHDSGMIGFPLRLLARENYDRAVAAKGRHRVALITGEEKIIPAGARYFLCTVESMPLARRVAFLGVDEIQMCADTDRGHVFTDRLLHARGERETMFMGAVTVRPLLRRLVPEAEFVSRPRFSTLRYAGGRKTTRLPPRTAVVAFSAGDVYAIAELVRRQRGGAAVVLGALSPRTRNAQVAMYQAGEVGTLVATDAIGMGLNMDIDHVAFAATRKFDGHVLRDLAPQELAQIAGRAGRHMNDGTFGTTADAGPLTADTVDRIEGHRFDSLRFVFWRNRELVFTSLAALVASLAQPPDRAGLVRVRDADDEQALAVLSQDPDIARLASSLDPLRLLWEVCGIPDFGKTMTDGHARLLARIYRHLTGPDGRLPTDWVAGHVARIDRTDGDIDTLAQRIAGIRTWTYVSYRGDWLADAGHWQERTRAVEDRLSDALHERLTQRFVDRRTALLVNRMRTRQGLSAAVAVTGEVHVEGHFVGHLEGFRFLADRRAASDAPGRAVAAAAERALAGEVAHRLRRLEGDGDDHVALAADGRLTWRGEAVARLAAGPDALRPRIEPLDDGLLTADQRRRLGRRLAAWLDAHLAARLAPLRGLAAADLSGAARGVAFQVTEALGALPRRLVADQIAALGRDDRRRLRDLGLRLGRESVFLPALLKPAAAALCGVLWAAHRGVTPPPMPPPGRTTVPVADHIPAGFYQAVGFRPAGRLAVRIDILERLAARAFALARGGSFSVGPDLLNLAGCGAAEMEEILAVLGYRKDGGDDAVTFRPAGRGRAAPARRRRRPAVDDESPFAKLRELTPAP